MSRVNVKERVNTNNRINMNHFDNDDELKVYKVFDDYYYPPREKLIWRKRRKNIYFASSILCTVGGVVYCIDIEDGTSDMSDITTSNKTYFIKESNVNDINTILESQELDLLEENKEELKEAIEIAKASLEMSGERSVIDLRSMPNESFDDINITKSDNKVEDNKSKDEEDYYSYNLEVELENSLNVSQHLISDDSEEEVVLIDTSNAMKYWDYFEYYGYTYGVDPYLLVAIATQESGGDHYNTIAGGDKYNGYGYGIMQIEQPGTITKKITAYNHTTQSYDVMQIDSEKDVYSVSSNIKAGAMMFAQKAKENQYNPYVTIQAYNYGVSGVNYALSYYLADGDNDKVDEIFNNKKQLSEYISSNNSDWLNKTTSSGLTAREWYSNEGWKKFGVGKGDSNYFEHIIKYYDNNSDNNDDNNDDNNSNKDTPYIVTNSGIKIYF